MTLRSRLALLFAAVALAASGLVGLFTYQTTAGELENTIDDFVRQRAVEIGDGLRDTPRGRRPQAPVDNITLRGAADDDSIIQVTGENGRSISTGAPLPAAVERSGYENVTIEDESYRMFTQSLDDGRTVQVARSTAESERVLSTLFSRFALIAAAVALAAAAIGWYIATRTTSPLRRLASVANNVAETGDFTAAGSLDTADRSDEIGSLTASFRSMLEVLESSRAQHHRLIHDAGHELRTPLTSMRANIELLERAGDLPADQRTEVVVAIKSELVELNDLFNEMIDLATAQDNAEVVFAPVDLGDVAEAVVERWRRRSDRAIELVRSPESAVVLGDAAMLERALSNLVSNAAKFSPPGLPIEVHSHGGALSVRDAGPGVPLADRPFIFDRFHRSEQTRSMPGSGLGLSIVAQIVSRHGGTTWVGDVPSVGGRSVGAEVGFRLQIVEATVGSSKLG